MPQSVGEVGITTVALLIGMALCYLAVRRWGTEDGPDALVVLWRRWGALGRPKVEEPPPTRKRSPRKRIEAKATAARPRKARPRSTEPPRKRAARARTKTRKRIARLKADDGDHMPLGALRADRRESEHAEPRAGMRLRFRRGLRRTREKLGRDVKEVFRAGPSDVGFDQLEEALVAADVGIATATALVDRLRSDARLTADNLLETLRDLMVAQLAEPDRRLRLVRQRLTVWVVVGVNGTGKTTSIAKLAARAQALGLSVCLAAGDTFRAAGVEQLEEWGRRLGVDVVRQKTGADPGAVVFDAIAHARSADHELLIVDTAGRLHTRKPLMEELRKVVRIIEKDENAALAEVLLVVDATTGQNGIAQARAFGEAVDVSGLVLAKLDGTAKGGITFAVERELDIPVKAVGVGERDRDLVPFEPDAFVDAILGGPGE
ncbi:MAG: signal recognition particle-docking protein FtsY [Actinomycetota bacterium]